MIGGLTEFRTPCHSLTAGGACPAPTNAGINFRADQAYPAGRKLTQTNMNNWIGPHGRVPRGSAPRPHSAGARYLLGAGHARPAANRLAANRAVIASLQHSHLTSRSTHRFEHSET